MVRILKISDIDRGKLDSLFEKRGHGIVNPLFQQKIVDILEPPDSQYEVYQCSCGEVFWMPKEEAKTQIERFNSENFPCFKCQNITEGKLSLLLIKKVVDICEQLREYEGNNQLSESQKEALLDQIISKAKGIIPTTSLDEMYLGLRDIIYNIESNLNVRTATSMSEYSPLDELFQKTIKSCPDIFDKLTNVSRIAELRAAAKNSDLAYISVKSNAELITALKFAGVPLQDYLPDHANSKAVEGEINRKMALYKNLFEEGRYYLDLLLNLIHAIEGLPVEVSPFDRHTLSTKSKKGKAIRGMADKIELFNHLKPGMALYPLLKDAYDNKLRNDDGHNQYQISTQKRTIRSLKYKREISFEELDQKIGGLISLHTYIGSFWRNYYPLTKHRYIKNMGIEELNFGYEDSFAVDGFPFPLGYALPVLGIIQYWDFAYYENGLRYIPVPEISIDNGTVTVCFENGSMITHEVDKAMEFWLSHVISCGKFKIWLHTIAPLLPWFDKDSMASMPINNLPEVNIMQHDEKEVKLSDTLKKQIISAIDLGV